ncbi:hypothetical protein DOY81_011307 [Sarcophaga bullata]|nr:hypothetical protein DOY81_011307 [Sarcophaga bullata]
MMNQNVCRCCLYASPPLTYKIFDENSNLKDDLMACLPATVKCECNDGLPQIICDLCWLQVRKFKEFREQCLQADQELRNRYAEYKNQAVEEVLGLVEQLRQKDNTDGNIWANREICHVYDETVDLNNFENTAAEFNSFDTLELGSMPGDMDVYNSSHDSGIFEEDLPVESCNDLADLEDFLPKDSTTKRNTNSTKTSADPPKSPQSSGKTRKRKNYKGPFQCSHCDKKFTRNFQLKLHLISVHQIGGSLQYNCKICNKTFASNHSLSYHQKSVHYQQKPHACQQCDKQFVLKTQLVSHMRIHTGETKPRIYECEKCDKKWPTRSDLKTHMRSHNPKTERPFKCERCEKSFFTRGHLSSHELVHTGEKPFPCEFCGLAYQSVGNLNNHMARCHMQEILNENENEDSKSTKEASDDEDNDECDK